MSIDQNITCYYFLTSRSLINLCTRYTTTAPLCTSNLGIWHPTTQRIYTLIGPPCGVLFTTKRLRLFGSGNSDPDWTKDLAIRWTCAKTRGSMSFSPTSSEWSITACSRLIMMYTFLLETRMNARDCVVSWDRHNLWWCIVVSSSNNKRGVCAQNVMLITSSSFL